MKKHKEKIALFNMLTSAIGQIEKAERQHILTRLIDFNSRCFEISKSSKVFSVALDKGWFKAAGQVRTQLNRNFCELSRYLQSFKDLINSEDTRPQTLSEIYADIIQLEQEFGKLKIDFKEKTLSIITESIELDGIEFGPFKVMLLIDKVSTLYNDSPYRVIAMDPNPAATNSDITHPHVSGDILCEGDGHIPIRKAIEQGRICDFFTLIVNILKTYNPDSPYINLDEWSGISCYDCGYTTNRENIFYCYSCENDFCEECSSYCRCCDETVCLGCGGECSNCGEFICHNCMTKCQLCQKPLCNACIEENDLCPECSELENLENNENEEQENSTNSQTCTSVQPDRVGEAAVLPEHN